jgi:hypothetical protein
MLSAGDPSAMAAAVADSPLGKWLPSNGDGIVRTILPKGKPMVGFILKGEGKQKKKK